MEVTKEFLENKADKLYEISQQLDDIQSKLINIIIELQKPCILEEDIEIF